MKSMRLNWMIIPLVIACVAALVGMGILTAVCVSAQRTWPAENADCIVVLGALVWPDGTMSKTLRQRCEAALNAWQAGLAPAIIVCGGQGSREPMPEAERMAAWFREQGVPDEALYIDNASEDTTQNMVNAKAIMDRNGFKTALICTSDYHVRRSLWLARDHGIAATGALASPSPTNTAKLIESRLRETCSWILYFLGVP